MPKNGCGSNHSPVNDCPSLAIVIPPCRSSRPIAFLVILSFLASFILSRFTALPESVSMIVLTIALSSLGALLFPRGGDDA